MVGHEKNIKFIKLASVLYTVLINLLPTRLNWLAILNIFCDWRIIFWRHVRWIGFIAGQFRHRSWIASTHCMASSSAQTHTHSSNPQTHYQYLLLFTFSMSLALLTC